MARVRLPNNWLPRWYRFGIISKAAANGRWRHSSAGFKACKSRADVRAAAAVSVAEALRFQRLEARVAKLEGLLDELTAILAPEHDATASFERPTATTSSHGMSTSAYFSNRCLWWKQRPPIQAIKALEAAKARITESEKKR
jgi:hypothetical protein